MIIYRFALLGAGFIGSVHAASLADHLRIDFAVIYDIDSLHLMTASKHKPSPRQPLDR